MLEALLLWLTGDTGRVLLTLIFALFWKVAHSTVTRAIPFLGAVANILLAIMNAAIATRPPDASTALMAVAVIPIAFPWGQLVAAAVGVVIDGLTTWAIAIGTHSGTKNFVQWRSEGGRFFKAATTRG